MRDVVYRFSIVAVFLLAFGMLSGLVLAQEPPTLEISLVPQTEFAVAGQPFTYTVVVTNIGPIPQEELIVLVETPLGTSLIETKQNTTWPVGVHHADATDTIVWNALEPIAPTGVVTFEVILNVLPEMVDQQLVIKNAEILNQTNGEVIAVGLPATVQVLAPPTTTATPTSEPTATRIVVSTATAPPPPSPTPPAPAPPTPQMEPNSSTPTPLTVSPPADQPPTSLALLIGGILVLGGGLMSLVWFLRRK